MDIMKQILALLLTLALIQAAQPFSTDALELGDIMVFDWEPRSGVNERMDEHLRSAHRGILPWDVYTDLSALPTLLTGGLLYVLSTLGLYDRSFDMIPGRFDHNALYIGKCSEAVRIAGRYGAEEAEARIREIWEKEGDKPLLFEAANPELGTRILSTDEYFRADIMKGAEVSVLRVKEADTEIKEKAAGFALTKYGLPYDMLPFIHGTGGWFDSALDENAYYCSEIVWAAYYQASDGRIDLNTFSYSNPIGCHPPLRANAVLPDELFYSNKTEIILPPKVYIE